MGVGQSEFPESLFRRLLVGSSQLHAVIKHAVVHTVTLTRCSPAGRSVAVQADSILRVQKTGED